jgi:hypothetical protein
MSGPAKTAIKPKSGSSVSKDDPAQYKRFLEAAKKAEAADSKEAADRAFKKVTTPPKPKSSQGR